MQTNTRFFFKNNTGNLKNTCQVKTKVQIMRDREREREREREVVTI
jgi:hypothetical protein